MRRFAEFRQLDRLLEKNKIPPRHIDNLAATIARFHGNLPRAEINSLFGTAETIRLDAEQNFELLQSLRTYQPLSTKEQGYTAAFLNESEGIVADAAGWHRLRQLLS